VDDTSSIIDVASKLDVVTILVLIGIAGARAFWVFGWVYRDQVDQTTYWRGVAERLLNIAETTTERMPPVVESQRRAGRFGSGSDD
jgi:hypothetical protein